MNINLKDQPIERLYNWDGFALLKITTPEETYFKVFGSSSGGYLNGDVWRLCSEVKSVEYDDDYIYFRTLTGSLYKAPVGGGHISAYCQGVLSSILREDEVELIDIEGLESEFTIYNIRMVRL